MDLAHSRPHKSFRRAPSKPFNSFLAAVKRVAENWVDKRKAGRGPAPRFYEGDARDLPLSNSSFDVVITSPPYLNAIDYIRCSKFTLVWMGHSVAQLRRIRATSVGTGSHQNGEADQEIAEIISELKLRPKLMPAREEVLARYIHDMRLSLQDKRRRHQNILCSTICAVI